MQINVTNLPERFRSVIAWTTFATKQETAEHYSVHFYCDKLKVWRVFTSNVPEKLRQEIIAKCNSLNSIGRKALKEV